MAIMMPEADSAVLKRRAEIVAALRTIVPGEGVIDSASEMLAYESDGLTAYRQPPMVVVLPDTTEQVSKVLKYCHEHGIKVVPRGSGTSLSGGALPDFRPSIPLSSGPTLFLAPSPIAWHGRHLLNEDLPAATSCASAPEAAADVAATTRKLRISLFMAGALCICGEEIGVSKLFSHDLQARHKRPDAWRRHHFFRADDSAIAVPELSKPIQSRADMLDLA